MENKNEFYIRDLYISDNPKIPKQVDQMLHIITPEDENGDCHELYVYVQKTKLEKRYKMADNRRRILKQELNYKTGTEANVKGFFEKFFSGIFKIKSI